MWIIQLHSESRSSGGCLRHQAVCFHGLYYDMDQGLSESMQQAVDPILRACLHHQRIVQRSMGGLSTCSALQNAQGTIHRALPGMFTGTASTAKAPVLHPSSGKHMGNGHVVLHWDAPHGAQRQCRHAQRVPQTNSWNVGKMMCDLIGMGPYHLLTQAVLWTRAGLALANNCLPLLSDHVWHVSTSVLAGRWKQSPFGSALPLASWNLAALRKWLDSEQSFK